MELQIVWVGRDAQTEHPLPHACSIWTQYTPESKLSVHVSQILPKQEEATISTSIQWMKAQEAERLLRNLARRWGYFNHLDFTVCWTGHDRLDLSVFTWKKITAVWLWIELNGFGWPGWSHPPS